jgi:uncharacterized peroxidase-related enzyme
MSFLREEPLDERNYAPFAEVQRQFGFIPNFYRAQTIRPDLIEAQMQLVQAILLKVGGLSRAQKEYIFLVCSADNLSTYCVTAHCEMVRMLGLKGPEPEKIAIDHLNTDLSIPDKALLNFALKLNRESPKVNRRDIEGLKRYDFTDEQILEAVLITGLAGYANVVSAGLGSQPDFEPTPLPGRTT